MHQKLTKHGRYFKQHNELPTKKHDELEDNSNVWGLAANNKSLLQVYHWRHM